jgi:hypothetical protein
MSQPIADGTADAHAGRVPWIIATVGLARLAVNVGCGYGIFGGPGRHASTRSKTAKASSSPCASAHRQSYGRRREAPLESQRGGL